MTTPGSYNENPVWTDDQLISNDLYRLLFETANDAILFMNPIRFIECNTLAVKMFGGISKSAILKVFPWQLSPEFQPDGTSSREKALKYITAATAGEPQRFYWKHRKLDGTLFDAEVSLNSILINNDVFVQSIVRDISSYTESENALRLNEQKYKAIFNNVQDVFYQTDKNSIITLVSPSIARYSDYTAEQLIGQHVASLYKDASQRDKLIELLFRDGQINDFEAELIAGSGKTVMVSINAHILLNDQNEFSGIEGSLRDITDRKMAHEEVVRERILLRTLIDNIPDTVYVKDIQGRKIIANEADLAHIGTMTEADIIGKTDLELFPGAAGQHGYHQDMRVIAEGKPIINSISTYTDAEGKTRWLNTSKIPLFDTENNLNGLVGIGHDITADIEAGRALRESEEKYRTLIESMPDGVYRSTPDGRFLEANQALVNILGYSSKEELLSIDIRRDLYFDLSDRESAMLTEQHEEMAIYPLRKKDGSKIWVEDHGWFKTDEDGHVVFHEGVLRDITERYTYQLKLQQYADELKTANDTKDKLFSIIAHDLLSPFNAMLGFTALLTDHPDDLTEDEKNELITRLRSTAENTYALLEKLLTWSRSQRGKIVVSKTYFSLQQVAAEVCKVLTDVASRKQIVLLNEVDERLIVYADPAMTNVILYNLTVNALKYSFVGGRVTLSATDIGKRVEIRVADNGTGMPAEKAESLFKPGFGQSTPGTANEKGTGLGLIICKEFVDKHDGKIWVVSQPGNGTVVSFCFPAHQPVGNDELQ